MTKFLVLYVNARLRWAWYEFDNKKDAEKKFDELNSFKVTRVLLVKTLKDTRCLANETTKENKSNVR